nr:MAG TPA: hypothetical protein [Caudoviricetes sp.]
MQPVPKRSLRRFAPPPFTQGELWFLRDAKSEISRQAEGFGPSRAGKFAGERRRPQAARRSRASGRSPLKPPAGRFGLRAYAAACRGLRGRRTGTAGFYRVYFTI